MVDSIRFIYFIIFNRPSIAPRLAMQWLGDHYRWYRRLKKGHWYTWGGYWEREKVGGFLHYQRGLNGINALTEDEYWQVDQVFPLAALLPEEIELLEPRLTISH